MGKKSKPVLKYGEGNDWLNESFEEGITFADLGIETDGDLFDFIYESQPELEVLQRKPNGYLDAYESTYRDSREEEVVFYKVKDNVYLIFGEEEIREDGIGFLSFPIYLTTSYEDALDYYNSIEHQDYSIKDQIKEIHEKLDDKIDGLWVDAKMNRYSYAWNIKDGYDLLIEKTGVLDSDEIYQEFQRYDRFCKKCDEAGIHIRSIYKKPRGWNNNQRYYVFEFWSAGKEWIYEAHIPSKMQGRKRKILDYFDNKWFSEMALAQELFVKNGGAKCSICGQGMLNSDGCTITHISINGKPVSRIKVKKSDTSEADGRCFDCGAKEGFYHHEGCDMEKCPVCGGQLISCDCQKTYVEIK